jgi:hypothetical protein
MFRLISRKPLCQKPTQQQQAQQSQRLWDMLVPERNIGITHPMFFFLGAAAFGLHVFNRHREDALEAELKERRLKREEEHRR